MAMVRSGFFLAQLLGLLLFWAGTLLAAPGNWLKTLGEQICDRDWEG